MGMAPKDQGGRTLCRMAQKDLTLDVYQQKGRVKGLLAPSVRTATPFRDYCGR